MLPIWRAPQVGGRGDVHPAVRPGALPQGKRALAGGRATRHVQRPTAARSASPLFGRRSTAGRGWALIADPAGAGVSVEAGSAAGEAQLGPPPSCLAPPPSQPRLPPASPLHTLARPRSPTTTTRWRSLRRGPRSSSRASDGCTSRRCARSVRAGRAAAGGSGLGGQRVGQAAGGVGPGGQGEAGQEACAEVGCARVSVCLCAKGCCSPPSSG